MSRAGALEGRRVFKMGAPSVYTTHDGNGWLDKTVSGKDYNSGGWQAIGANGMYYETYIDLSGYELDDLTLFPGNAHLQDPGLYTAKLATATNLWVMDVMSQERLSSTTLNNMLDATLSQYNNAPGMMGTNIDWTEVTFGNLRVMASTLMATGESNLEPWIVQAQSDFGSGQPVVVQKLWCYRFINCVGAAADEIHIPASRFILLGTVRKETDNVYIQRLRNSYELQGSVE